MANTHPDATAERLVDLCRTYLRLPASYASDTVTGLPVLEFVPVLTVAEQATYDDLLKMAGSSMTSAITLAEYQALKPDLAGLRTYAGIATPTLVQTANAVKAQSRVLRALLRD